MRTWRKAASMIAGFCLLACLRPVQPWAQSGTRQLYRWVDEQGVVHLSNQEPPRAAGNVDVEPLPRYAPSAPQRDTTNYSVVEQARRLERERLEREEARRREILRQLELEERQAELEAARAQAARSAQVADPASGSDAQGTPTVTVIIPSRGGDAQSPRGGTAKDAQGRGTSSGSRHSGGGRRFGSHNPSRPPG